MKRNFACCLTALLFMGPAITGRLTSAFPAETGQKSKEEKMVGEWELFRASEPSDKRLVKFEMDKNTKKLKGVYVTEDKKEKPIKIQIYDDKKLIFEVADLGASKGSFLFELEPKEDHFEGQSIDTRNKNTQPVKMVRKKKEGKKK